MEDVDKKTLEKHTKALNRVADVIGDFLNGLPGFLSQLERNEALMQAQSSRVKTKSQITKEIEKYEESKKKDEKKGSTGK